MRRVLIACAALVLIVGFAAPSAEAQQCVKWVAFCDGIQIDNIGAGTIAATWYNYDCANSWPGMVGVIAPGLVPNACAGGNGDAGIVARIADGSPVGDWLFTVDGSIDGTLDMNSGLPGGNLGCWVDEIEYTLAMGECTGSFAPGSPQNISSVQ